MIFDNTVIQNIIDLLIQYHSLTMTEIVLYIQKEHEISQAQLYRLIEKLIDKQILIKQKRKLLINSVWVVTLQDFTEKLLEGIEKQQHIKKLRIGEKMRLTGSSLYTIGGLYGDIYTRLIKRENPHTLYHYQSHCYYPNAFPETEKQFWSSLSVGGIQQKVIYGNKTYLTSRGKEFVEKHSDAQVVCDYHKDFPLEGYMVVIIGNYVVDMIMPPLISKIFESLYLSMNNEESFDQKVFRSVFYQKEKCHITIDHNPERAELLIRKISTFVTRKMKGL